MIGSKKNLYEYLVREKTQNIKNGSLNRFSAQNWHTFQIPAIKILRMFLLCILTIYIYIHIHIIKVCIGLVFNKLNWYVAYHKMLHFSYKVFNSIFIDLMSSNEKLSAHRHGCKFEHYTLT